MKQQPEGIQKDKLDELLTIKEVMSHLKLSRQKVYLLTKDGELPAYKIGNSVRYKLTDVVNLLQPLNTNAA